MASLHNLVLAISERNGLAQVEVTYRIDGSRIDIANEHSYQELVELIGMDEGPGEDGRSELIPNGRILDQVITFRSTETQFFRSPLRITVPSALLEEDQGITIQPDEIRARVTLNPLPPRSVSSMTNMVRRGGLANNAPV